MKANNIIHGDVSLAGILSSAEKIYYNNTGSGLNTENVQGAINELDASVKYLYDNPVGGGGEAWNGLTKTDNSIGLGSELNKDTSIYLNDNTLSIISHMSPLPPFNSGTGFEYDESYAYVNCITIDHSNRILIGGFFTTYDGSEANNIIRLNEDGTIDQTFDSGTGFEHDWGASLSSIVIDFSNRILVGGRFTSYDGSEANNIIRLNEDGTIDQTFNSGTGFEHDEGATIGSIVIDPSNRILAVGSFTTYDGSEANNIIRLNEDGTIDQTFNSGTGFDAYVDSIVIDPNNRILAVGFFTTYDGSEANNIIRLNEDGTIDQTFNSGTGFDVDGEVYSIVIDSINRILIGGSFTTYDGSEANNIIRLNEDGTIDQTFDSGTGFEYDESYAYVNCITIDHSNRILIGGFFTTYDGSEANNIIRLNEDGTIDQTFDSGTGFEYDESYAYVNCITIDHSNRILIGGFFTTYDGSTANGIIKLNEDGTIDTGNTDNKIIYFSEGLLKYKDEYYNSFDNRTLPDVGWVHATIDACAAGSVSSEAWNGLTKTDNSIGLGGTLYDNVNINTEGYTFQFSTRIPIFNIGTGFNDAIESITTDQNDQILVGGRFTSYDGSTYNRIIRLNNDGTIDNSFDVGTGFNGRVYGVGIDQNNKIVVCGSFTQYNGFNYNGIIRLNDDGTIDNTFNVGTGFNNDVTTIAIDSNNKILLGGAFTRYNGNNSLYLVRLNDDGTLDNVFANFSSLVTSIFIDSANKILVGGGFVSYDGSTYNRIIRLNDDGTIDNTFNIGTGFNDTVLKLIEDSNNKILVGGGFDSYDGSTYNRIIRLNNDGTIDNSFDVGTGFDDLVYGICEDSNNNIYIGGFFTTYDGSAFNRIIGLNYNGTINNSFDVGSGLNDISLTAITDINDKILIGGQFTQYNGTGVNRIVRINQNGSIDADVTYQTYMGTTVQYSNDLSQYYSDRSLPDVAWVHSNFQTIPIFNSPGSASDGSMGALMYDASYLYICTSTNTWGRILLETGY